jgi:hypothetical protein
MEDAIRHLNRLLTKPMANAWQERSGVVVQSLVPVAETDTAFCSRLGKNRQPTGAARRTNVPRCSTHGPRRRQRGHHGVRTADRRFARRANGRPLSAAQGTGQGSPAERDGDADRQRTVTPSTPLSSARPAEFEPATDRYGKWLRLLRCAALGQPLFQRFQAFLC